MPAFTLELLHFTDQEANAATIGNIDNLSAVLNALRAEDLGNDGVEDNTLTLSSGDVIIPGLFFDASAEVFGSAGIADVQIQNELGLQAAALGNHEFDLGTSFLAGLIDGSAPGDFAALSGTAIDGQDFEGALFPYLSANLGFDTDPALGPLEISGGQDAVAGANKVTSSTIIDVNGEQIAIIGATVPTIDAISSAGPDIGIFPVSFDSTPTPEQLDALAAILQAEVNEVLAANTGLNKVVLLSHMQQITIEQGLAERLENVDIIVAGGSNTRLFDEDDRVRDGDSDQGDYPQFIENAGGTKTALVNTDGNYKYVGRLVIDFDEDGNILEESYDATVSGAYATDDQGVADLGAESLVDPEIDAITDAIQAQIVLTESNVFGVSEVFLTGNRSGTFDPFDPDGVRTQETNLGNLTADANLEYAQTFDSDVVISIKNGGGIRANIGETVVPAGGTEAIRVPNSPVVDSEGNVVKPEGGISQNDIQTVLAFNNGLTLLDITRAELKSFLEGAVSALPSVSGGFPHISGIVFSFDQTKTAQTFNDDNTVDVPGERVQNAAIVDENGDVIAEIVRDGQLVGDPNESFRLVTLDFLANAGDQVLSKLSNPNRADLKDLDGNGVDDGAQTGAATFADDGSEQDALAEYLNDNFNPLNPETPDAQAFNEADTGPLQDARIQNLAFRPDTVFEADVTLEQVFVAEGDEDGEGGSEVVAYEDGKFYVTNGAQDRIDVWELGSDNPAFSIDLSGIKRFDSVQSVAASHGLVAAAISRENRDVGNGELARKGLVVFADAETGEIIETVKVGFLPDSIAFTPDGSKLIVANEGEFNEDSVDDGVLVNPKGSISIIDIEKQEPAPDFGGGFLGRFLSKLFNRDDDDLGFFGGLAKAFLSKFVPDQDEIEYEFETTNLNFNKFNRDGRLPDDVRISADFKANRDLEPEYVTISPDGETAYVTLQENNAVALVDLETNTISEIRSLGSVDYSQPENAADFTDGDGKIEFITADAIGLRMADAIVAFEVDGNSYYATANEGDGRGDAADTADGTGFDEARVGDVIAGEVFIDGEMVNFDESVDTTGLERLKISVVDGDTDGDGDIDQITSFGSRSFTIFDEDGDVVFDSGNELERLIATLATDRFLDDDGDDFRDLDEGQDRADDKGGEPEAIEFGQIGDDSFLFIGLERDSSVVIYNINDPGDAEFVSYIDGFETGNLGPETIDFIAGSEFDDGIARLAVAYEVSSTTAIYTLEDLMV